MQRDPTERKAVDEVDHSLIDWYRGMSMIERQRAASRSAALLERLARAAAELARLGADEIDQARTSLT